jgi:hypothetical protein
LVEALADFDQQIAQADVIGNARRIADCAKVDRGEILQTSQAVIVHHPPGSQVIIAAPVEFFGVDLKAAGAGGRAQDAQPRGDHFLADAVAGDDGYAVFLHGSTLGAQVSLPASLGQSAIAGSPQARMPALPEGILILSARRIAT